MLLDWLYFIFAILVILFLYLLITYKSPLCPLCKHESVSHRGFGDYCSEDIKTWSLGTDDIYRAKYEWCKCSLTPEEVEYNAIWNKK
jgi:hypothetical protein